MYVDLKKNTSNLERISKEFQVKVNNKKYYNKHGIIATILFWSYTSTCHNLYITFILLYVEGGVGSKQRKSVHLILTIVYLLSQYYIYLHILVFHCVSEYHFKNQTLKFYVLCYPGNTLDNNV